MRVTVVGTGYVGLVLGTCLSDVGNEVTCVDKELQKVRMLQRGRVPIYEPGLETLVKRNAQQGRLAFTSDLGKAVARAQVVFIAVPTPEGESGDADLQYVLQAAAQVGRALRQYTVVVNKSTVPVGTADKVREVIAAETDVAFDVVSNPEFLKEGAALEDFFHPDRVVIGTSSDRAARVMAELYAPFTAPERPVLYMDNRSAELTKYACNAMLATRISFMNDLAQLCERVGADIAHIRAGMGKDSRIGPAFLHAGIGYGGSCFPKDVKALVSTARDEGLVLDLLRAVTRTNERQKRVLFDKALKHYGSLSGKTFAVWGLAFKPETDDMREAPAVELVEALLAKGAHVQCYDPVAREVAQRCFGDRVYYAPTAYDALEDADGLFVVTEWSEFKSADLTRVRDLLKAPILFDGRNLYEPAEVRALGFTYYPVGRSAAYPAGSPERRAPAKVLSAPTPLGAGRRARGGLQARVAPMRQRPAERSAEEQAGE